MADYTITKIEQTTRFGKDMEPEEVYTLTFTVGDSGPFTVSIPSKDYTASRGRDAVLGIAQEIGSTLGA